MSKGVSKDLTREVQNLKLPETDTTNNDKAQIDCGDEQILTGDASFQDENTKARAGHGLSSLSATKNGMRCKLQNVE